MRFTIFFYTASMLLVSAIVAVAVLWTHLSHRKIFEGPRLASLWSTHGLHAFDLVVLAVELLLVALLSIVLLAGFSRRP
ncbi:MAG TPA: hypothetical protein VD789_00860 [Thermomicrobiales bacterium]|nr:hypothetical protein [Thermomicrobiales bacterium]